MKPFLDDAFLLDTPFAIDLYEQYAKRQPIIDYHCHLSPTHVANNHRFRSITEAWLDGDHYKWRALRADGTPERLITGDASDWEKFSAWAATVPRTLRNPLYHWTHMELKFPFGVTTRLSPLSAKTIFDHCNDRLSGDTFTAQGLLQQYDVRVVCTTDDPVDSLEPHRKYAAAAGRVQLRPTWRPDRAFTAGDVERWNEWVEDLERSSNLSISTCEQFVAALERRHEVFHQAGCRLSDHGLDKLPDAVPSAFAATDAFNKLRARKALTPGEEDVFRSTLLHEMALWDHRRGWVQQFHLGPLRNTNTRMRTSLGPDTGFDSIGDLPQALALARFLDRLDATNQLAKTIVYNLNPADNETFATVSGSFQDGSIPGKMQWGSAWWFLDQKDGIEKQLNALSNLGLLSRFVGMLTDSRSFLSYSRHDYFRRILCNLLGNDVDKGLLPSDLPLLGELVSAVSYGNAQRYFGFPDL